MKATLYKLKEGYVICSKDYIEPNSLYINNGVLFTSDSVYDEGNNPNSSNPKVTDRNYKVLTQSPDFSSLSEKDAKRIGWFDIDKMALENCKNIIPSHKEQDITTEIWISGARQVGFREGFQKALSLTADRRFTEEDIKKAFHFGCLCKAGDLKKDYGELIKSLSQPKSWEVEYREENGVYKVLSVS